MKAKSFYKNNKHNNMNPKEKENNQEEELKTQATPCLLYTSAFAKLQMMIESYKIDAVAIGNGTASRETEEFLKHQRFNRDIQIFIVSEQGASIYSASVSYTHLDVYKRQHFIHIERGTVCHTENGYLLPIRLGHIHRVDNTRRRIEVEAEILE